MPRSDEISPEPIKPRILMVDDHPRNLVALAAVLEPLEVQLVSAESGTEALRWLLREEFAVILLDVQMPDLDGFRTAALIKQREQTRRVPIIFITATAADDSLTKAYAHGGADFLQKPFDPDILRAKVGIFLELYVQRKQIERQAALLLERERFIGILGHDLRTPLASILLRASTTVRPGHRSIDPMEVIQRISESAARMARMIDDLLDFTRSRHGGLRLQPRPVDLHALCRQIIEEVDSAHSGPATIFEADGDGTGQWDPDRLAQVVANLVSNAVSYSASGSRVGVRV